MNKFLIVGLGNIGLEYSNTRHNIGFKILDKLAEALNIEFKVERYCFHSEINYKGKKIILIKPTTYMNLSGKSVKYWKEKEKILLENILVVTDDISLDFGIFRLRKKGSDGGHNGLKNINEILLTNEYPRFRFGIGKDFPKGKQVDYVLGEWTKEQKEILENEKLEKGKDLILTYILNGIDRTMNIYNN